MKTFLLRLFTWWNGQTFGTWLHTRRFGERVGTDEFGNVYYRSRGGALDPALGLERRWVIYNGEAEASTIPPGWYGWMHHRYDTPPRPDDRIASYVKPHLPNLTGTARAYRPKGSIVSTGHRPKATGDYQAWSPEG